MKAKFNINITEIRMTDDLETANKTTSRNNGKPICRNKMKK